MTVSGPDPQTGAGGDPAVVPPVVWPEGLADAPALTSAMRAARASDGPLRTVLIVGVGNVLRGDDMFGVELSRALEKLQLPPGVHITETGIAGLSLVQELMTGYDGLIICDAVMRKKPPGTLVVLEPRVPDPSEMSELDRKDFFADLHQADPSRGLMMAKAVGCLPAHIRIVGCEVGDCDELLMDMTPPVANALPVAVDMVLDILRDWLRVDLTRTEVPA